MRPVWHRGVIALVLAALSLSVPSIACAQDQDAAVEAMIRRGLSQRRHGHDEQAFQSFEEAWNVAHSPRARAQMGLAAQALGRWADAARFVRDALAATGDPWVTERRAVLERSLSEIDAHLGLLEVRCNIDGAEVRVDGTARGTTPLTEPLRMPAGSVTIQISAPNYIDVTRQAVLTTGRTTREQIDLVAVPAHAAPSVVVPVAAPVASAVTNPPTTGVPAATQAPVARGPVPVEGPPLVVAPPRDSGSTRRVLAWTSGGVAVAGLALGAAFFVLRNASASSFNANNQDGDATNDCARGSTEPSCVTAESMVSTRATIATVGFVVGGAAAVASAVLFLTLPPRGERPRAGLRGCVVSPERDGLGAACEVTF